METLVVKVKSGKTAQLLSDFLKTIDYVQEVANIPGESSASASNMQEGNFSNHEKPSDFSGIWKNRKKIDAKKLRKQAWKD